MKTCIAVFTLLLLLLSGSCGPDPVKYDYPGFQNCNVILISLDTLRADHLGCYGYPKETSPNIDRFCHDAVFFTTPIAQASSTKPSHASIFTSLNVVNHGAFGGYYHILSDDFNTMAEILKENGYQTCSFNGGGFVKSVFGFEQAFDLYDSSFTGQFSPEVNRSKEWIKKHKDKKFFLFLHTYEVHHPYLPKKEYVDLFRGDYTGNLPDHITIEMLKKINKGELKITEEDRKHIIHMYDAEIRSMDQAFAVLIDFLKKDGLYDNSLIVVTSDHGEEFGEHGMMGWHSHTLYEEIIKVPLIIKFPFSKHAGTKIHDLVRSIDILPTLLSALDIEEPQGFEGFNLMKGITEGKVKKLFAISQLGLKKSAVRTKDWKLFGSELFNLSNDPLEQRDLAQENLQMKKTLNNTLKKFLKGRRDVSNNLGRPDQDTLEQLRALGYGK